MLRLMILAALSACAVGQQYQGKVAPGVPPQKYQQAPPPQQYQPPPPQHQQVPVQPQFQQPPQGYQQQPPQGYQQQQVPHQQVPQQQVPQQQVPQQQVQGHQQRAAPQHGAHGQHGDPQLLNPANIAHERDHIQEHMDVPIDTSKMSEQELQFHYFKMHDADNNNKLDGCELIKSLIHWHGEPNENTKSVPDGELEEFVQSSLEKADKDDDGYITYAEFVTNRIGH